MPTTITVTDAHGKKVRAKVGDNVTILRRVDVKRKKNAVVAKFPAPLIVNLERDGSKVCARVQFHTEDKRPHVQTFAGADLQLAQPMFKIGDSVEVVAPHSSLFVPVGCQGTVVGGDGTTFHVTFTVMTSADGTALPSSQTVSQTGVDGTALKFIKARVVQSPSASEDDSEEEEESSESDSSSSSDDDEKKEGDEDSSRSSSSSEQDEGEACTENDYFTTHMSDTARSALLRHLRANTLLSFKDWFQTKCQQGHVRVETLPQLQAVLIEFTRHTQPAFRLSPAHKVALRNIGATSADLLEIEHQPALRGGGLQEFMKFFTDMKRH